MSAGESYDWHLVQPLESASERSPVLAELSQFRGRILYGEGRRPGFWRMGQGYADYDPLDGNSYHVTVRKESELVGCIRIRPLPGHDQTSLGELITASQFAAFLKEMGLERNDCLDVGRWSVAPSARGTSVGRTLVASAWAVGRWLGKRLLLAAVGTRDGQAKMLTRLGGQVSPSFCVKFIEEYDDELSPMYFDLDQPPPSVALHLPSVERLLKLSDEEDALLQSSLREHV